MKSFPSYVLWALLSAVFAALTAVLGKRGVEAVPPNLAVAIRTTVVWVAAALIALVGREAHLTDVPRRAWVFLILSGLATAASWLCYYRALSLGPVSRIAPIDKLSFVLALALAMLFLGERPAPNVLAGAGLIVLGVLLTLRP